jgi:predicted nuclease with TOPRIM domain
MTYNVSAVRETIAVARSDQTREGITPTAHRRPASRASHDSLRTDLALSREDNQKLRDEVGRLRTRLQRRLGAEIEETNATDLLDRLRELETQATNANRQISTRDSEIARLTTRVTELENENEAKSEALRAMMFARNAPARSE